MSSLLASSLLWAQAGAQNQPAAIDIPVWLKNTIAWLFVWGDPVFVTSDWMGPWMLWIKALSLLALVGWLGSWLVTAIRERYLVRNRWYDYAALVAVIFIPLTMLLRTLEAAKQVPTYTLAGLPVATLITYLVVLVIGLWAELGVWRTVRRFGRFADVLVLVGIHFGLVLGIALGLTMQRLGILTSLLHGHNITWREAIAYGVRVSATYMGYVVLLRVAGLLIRELFAIRGRRLYSIARLSIYEANRKMGAPWIVLIIFGLVLAFTHWFLIPPRAAEMGRLFVGTLTLVCSLLLTVMVAILTPLSLPADIRQQTIYTVVSKPVRRLELIWGRMLGFMTLVTGLVVVFGGISLFYLWRQVNTTIVNTEAAALKAKAENRTRDYNQLMEAADQLRSRMAARVPVRGSLSFLDSKGAAHAMGIDVGMEQSMKQPRSHIEGATPATAIWRYGIVPDPFSPANRPVILDRKINVADFLPAGTVEGLLNRLYEIQYRVDAGKLSKEQSNLSAADLAKIDASLARNEDDLKRARTEYESLQKRADDLEAQAAQAEKSGDAAQAQRLRDQARDLHAEPIKVEMTFNVYRTTKGRVGDPVLAQMEVNNPRTGAESANIFPIKEYYTNQQLIEPKILAGSMGDLTIKIRCISPTQYLGMAESDLYLLSSSGNFGVNFMKGLFGVWLQAMVLTAIGVFAGTFLSWPVALLTTIAFFFAGQLAYGFLVDFSRQAILGGGPVESLIRLVTHDNQMSDLAPTAGVVIAKTLDSLFMPVMSMLVYVVPNFQALDVSNTVADGFAVSRAMMISNTLLALAYALPFSIVGYFILKNREVAA